MNPLARLAWLADHAGTTLVERRAPPAEISVTTDDPNVLAVSSFSDSSFILLATGVGETKVHVSGTLSSGATDEDQLAMIARAPQVLKLRHTCAGADAALLVDQDAVIAYDMKMSDGQPVIGYGYRPVTVTPVDALSIDETNPDPKLIHFHTSGTPQDVSIASTIDSTTASIQLVTSAQIDGVTVENHAPEIIKGYPWYYRIQPTVAGRPVCQAIVPFTVFSITLDVCDASYEAGPRYDEYGWVRVTGLAQGDCHVVVMSPTAAATSLRLTVL